MGKADTWSRFAGSCLSGMAPPPCQVPGLGDDGRLCSSLATNSGSAWKTILQGAGAALVGQLGNGQGLQAALGAMASQLAAGRVEDFATSMARALDDDPSYNGEFGGGFVIGNQQTRYAC